MKKYEVFYYLDVIASVEVEAETPEEAKEIAQFEEWSYDEEDVYEVVCQEIIEPDYKEAVESGVFTFETIGGLVKGHCK